jgi:hypothetical protein
MNKAWGEPSPNGFVCVACCLFWRPGGPVMGWDQVLSLPRAFPGGRRRQRGARCFIERRKAGVATRYKGWQAMMGDQQRTLDL